MTAIDGLTYLEFFVLEESEEPAPLWEIADALTDSEGQSPLGIEERVSLLGPALVSLVVHGLVEVRQFSFWPAAWERGVPVDANQVAAESHMIDRWSAGGGLSGPMVARVTLAGDRWL